MLRLAERGALHGTAETGGDLGAAARDTVIGALRGTREVADAALETIGTSVRMICATEGALLGAKSVGMNALDAVAAAAGAAVEGAARAHSDIGRTARSAVEGAIWGAKDLGVDATEVAAAAAGGALGAAQHIGAAAQREVAGALTAAIAGVLLTTKRDLSRP